MAAHVVLVVAIAIAFWQADRASQKVDTATSHTLGTLIAVQVGNCKDDRIFREQYRLRGQAEKELLELFVTLARQSLAALPRGSKQRQASEDFIAQFEPFATRIQIIPLPDCQMTEQHLRESIRESVTVPNFPAERVHRP